MTDPVKSFCTAPLLLALGCSSDPYDPVVLDANNDATRDAALAADAQGHVADAQQTVACGDAVSLEASSIVGSSPYGDLDFSFQENSLSNGCGAMKMRLTYTRKTEPTGRFHITFALPEIQHPREGAPHSRPGTYELQVGTALCNERGKDCTERDVQGTIEIRSLVDDSKSSDNTHLLLTINEDGWDLAPISVLGRSCSWVWNPC